MKICEKCNLEKPLIEYSKCGSYKDKIYYRPECKSCNREHQRKFGKAAQIRYRNTEKGKIGKKAHKKTLEYKEQQRIYAKNRRYTNPKFKLVTLLRSRIRRALLAKRWAKNNTLKQYIGCTLDFLKQHMENQFQNGMTWENQGDWHIDHIIPLDSAQTVEELYKLCHYTNLQPLWALDNMKKSNKIL